MKDSDVFVFMAKQSSGCPVSSVAILKVRNSVSVVQLYRFSDGDVFRHTIASLLQATPKTNRAPPFANKPEIMKEIPSKEASFRTC